MGSLNCKPIAVLRTEPEPEQAQKPIPGTKQESQRQISLLTNTIHYSLDYVFILVENDEFRLLVRHDNRLLADQRYRSMRGARIAFQKLFKRKAWSADVKAQWSFSYQPDASWLEEKLKPCERIIKIDC